MVWREYMENCSVHGLKFIVDRNIHWSERLFWVVCIVVSWYCSTLLIMASWESFSNNPISFVVETTYKDWKTNFPSITVCEAENSDRIEQASDSLWTMEHNFNLEEVLKEIAFYKGVSYYLMQFCNVPDSDPNCPKGNYTYFADTVRSKCDEILSNCTWFDNFFDCCEYFLPIDTELGLCYSINSLQGRDPLGKKLPMISDRTTGPGKLYFNVHVPAGIYVLGEEEVPTLTTLNSDILVVNGQIYYRRHIALKSIDNDLQARDVSPQKRRCKYPDEFPSSVYRYHSYSACTVECRKEAQMSTCGCTSFFIPNTTSETHCDIIGLSCLHDNYGQLSVLRAGWSSRIGLYCDCQPSCEESEITVVADDRISTQNAHSQVEISLDLLPSEKFRRNVIRAPLDLVVSIGATTGLFLGASMLSFVEVLYFFVFRGVKTLLTEEEEEENRKKTNWMQKLMNIFLNSALFKLFQGKRNDEKKYKIPKNFISGLEGFSTKDGLKTKRILVQGLYRKNKKVEPVKQI